MTTRKPRRPPSRLPPLGLAPETTLPSAPSAPGAPPSAPSTPSTSPDGTLDYRPFRLAVKNLETLGDRGVNPPAPSPPPVPTSKSLNNLRIVSDGTAWNTHVYVNDEELKIVTRLAIVGDSKDGLLYALLTVPAPQLDLTGLQRELDFLDEEEPK